MLKKLLRLFLFVLLLAGAEGAMAQRVALRTNLVDWAMLSPNLTVEARLSHRLTLGMGFAGNPLKLKIADCRLNTFRFQPELRYWFNRPMARHYMGVAALASLYDFRHKGTVSQGDIFALGLTYGYALVLSRQWNVEFTLGAGIGKTRYFKYAENAAKPKNPNNSKWIPVPMNIGVSFAYIFK